MASMPVRFDRYYFSSVAEAKRAFNAVRDHYVPFGIVTDPEHEHMIRALVEQHRNSAEKIGQGIEHFVVQSNTSLGARRKNYGIWIKQEGYEPLVEFGYSKVIRWLADPSNDRLERNRVEDALRNEIRSRTNAYLRREKESGRALVSDISGLPLDADGDIDVVHLTPTWGELIDTFLTRVGGASEVRSSQVERSMGEILTDEDMRTAWLEFHQESATLGLASPGERAPRTKGA